MIASKQMVPATLLSFLIRIQNKNLRKFNASFCSMYISFQYGLLTITMTNIQTNQKLRKKISMCPNWCYVASINNRQSGMSSLLCFLVCTSIFSLSRREQPTTKVILYKSCDELFLFLANTVTYNFKKMQVYFIIIHLCP